MNSLDNVERIVFDWDNTLVETSAHLKEVMDQAIEHMLNQGALLKADLQPGYWNYPLRELFNFPSQNLLLKTKSVYNMFLEDSSPSKIMLFDGAEELLNLLRSLGKKLFIISNKREAVLRDQVKESGLAELFESVVGSCEKTGVQKPSIDVFIKAFGKDVSPNEVLFIGDSSLDEESARNFGCNFIYVNAEASSDDGIQNEQSVDFHELIACFKNGRPPLECIQSDSLKR